ncbi:hypothetical protein R1flu_004562 [Riccia fluitans]|uniref:Uncharacterized protein n=1 Tax=Riccia fluitans TaxID=41844 RepID=A0ABD1YRA3_9MARC
MAIVRREFTVVQTTRIEDIASRLKHPETRREAYCQLKSFLCNKCLSAESTLRTIQDAISYAVEHPTAFTVEELFIIIDLALGNFSIPRRDKDRIHLWSRMATFKLGSSSKSSGLSLKPNLEVEVTRQGPYLRLFDLLFNIRSLKDFSTEMFEAMRSVALQAMVFTDEQYFRIANCALGHEAFSPSQKEYLRMWSEDRSRVTRESVEFNPPDAGSLKPTSRPGRICEDLQDAVGHQGAYLRLIQLLCGVKQNGVAKAELFGAVRTVASRADLFSYAHLIMLTDCALSNQSFTASEKRNIRSWREHRTRAIPNLEVPVPGSQWRVKGSVSSSRRQIDGKSNGASFSWRLHEIGRQANGEWSHGPTAAEPEFDSGEVNGAAIRGAIVWPWRNRCNSELFQKLKDSTTCLEAFNMVLDLVTEGRTCTLSTEWIDVFNAVSAIASNPKLFSNKQVSMVLSRAMQNSMFSAKQKEHFWTMARARLVPMYGTFYPESKVNPRKNKELTFQRAKAQSKSEGWSIRSWELRPELEHSTLMEPKEYLSDSEPTDRASVTSSQEDTDESVVGVVSSRNTDESVVCLTTFSEVAAYSNPKAQSRCNSKVFEELKDSATCQEAFKMVLELVADNRMLIGEKIDVFNAVKLIASKSELFSDEQVSILASRAFLNNEFSEKQKKAFSELKEDRLHGMRKV